MNKTNVGRLGAAEDMENVTAGASLPYIDNVNLITLPHVGGTLFLIEG